jgi:hypothetical protein
MNVSAIDPTSTAVTQSAAAANPPKKAPPSGPKSNGASRVAPLSAPAATSAITGVPASVEPEDRALYAQILKSVGGNMNAALEALAALKADEASAGKA